MRSMPVIGIDASALLSSHPTGVEHYTRFLLHEMMKEPLGENERVILYGRDPAPSSLTLPAGWSWKTLPFALPKGWTHLRLSKELYEHPVDIFFSPAHEVPLFTGSAKVVTTVHDVVFQAFPQAYPPFERFRQRCAVRHALRRATRILTVSEATKQDLLKYFHAAEARIRVTPPAGTVFERPGEETVNAVLQKYALKHGRYFFFLGRIEAKKNIGALIDAFAYFKKHSPSDVILVLGGGMGYGGDAIRRKGEASGVGDAIRFLGYIPADDVASITVGAAAFVFPSHGEGFGLPVLDAMTLGVPVLLSDIPVFHEVAGSAAEYVLTSDTEAFGKKLIALSQNAQLRAALIARAHAQSEKYSWRMTAQKTWAAIRSI